ncbi:DNA polymerase [Halarsenatibacter silvermanii]|uniref:Type-4 uracil-DNA glycosylase n=1 Tax=Halarsenatibacter silvermanii TaxID=321763 RepID=A0A1G9NYT2_9FIRM|nr:DNA polymerase [Halarsenatibacter silvermanii]
MSEVIRIFFTKEGKIRKNQLITYPNNSYEKLKSEARECQRCHLREQCTQVVMGEGSLENRIMLIGEGPGADEDEKGRPFVGRAGQLLNDIMKDVGLKREDLYISNIVKCRPPDNRAPKNDEMEACSPILKAEIEIVEPKVIMPLGSTALNYLVEDGLSITSKRGEWIERGELFFLPTFHPAYIFRNRGAEEDVRRDFKVLKKASERIEELYDCGF